MSHPPHPPSFAPLTLASILQKMCNYTHLFPKSVKCKITHQFLECDCRKNHIGSSKSMESSVACELWNYAPKDHVKFSAYVGDDDTTTLSRLTKNVPYGVEKLSDIIHAKRSLATRLHNLSSSSKFQDSSVLSQKVINYLTKCFSYCIAQNSIADHLKLALKCIVPHAFNW